MLMNKTNPVFNEAREQNVRDKNLWRERGIENFVEGIRFYDISQEVTKLSTALSQWPQKLPPSFIMRCVTFHYLSVKNLECYIHHGVPKCLEQNPSTSAVICYGV